MKAKDKTSKRMRSFSSIATRFSEHGNEHRNEFYGSTTNVDTAHTHNLKSSAASIKSTKSTKSSKSGISSFIARSVRSAKGSTASASVSASVSIWVLGSG